MRFDGITLVTGAAGFMGSHVVEHLVREGIKVRATARSRRDVSFFERLGVEFVAADLTDPATLPPLFDGKVDRVFHLGAICNFSTPYSKLYPTNVEGVRRLSGLALKHGVKCFVHVTSTSVYGRYGGTPFVEISPRRPCDDYGRSKKNGEDEIFTRMAEGLPAVVVRPCTVYGPRCNDGAGKVFSRPSAIAAIPGNGRQALSNVRAEDVAAAVLHLSRLDTAIGETYNIAEDSHPLLGKALRLAAEVFRTPPPKRQLPLILIRTLARLSGLAAGVRGKIPDLEYDATGYLADDYIVSNTKLKNTGFRFQYPEFETSIRQLGAWYHNAAA